jgi:hypothetical protein
MGHNIEQGAGVLTFVEIQRFCGICPKTFETDCSVIYSSVNFYDSIILGLDYDKHMRDYTS